MLRCRAKEEWVCQTGVMFPHLQGPTTAYQTKQTLTCYGQLEGWEGRMMERGDSPVWDGREATAGIKIEIAWVVHKKNDRAQGRARYDVRVGSERGCVEQSCAHPWSW